MARYSDPFVCPDCATRLPVQVRTCPGCGLLLQGPLASDLLNTLQTADRLLAQLRAESAPRPTPEPWPSYPSPASGPAPATALPRRDRSNGLSGVSVPRILLGLGALCLLVAAVIFLAVAWSWLGVGGRTTILVALTAITGGLALWLGRRDLTVAAESLVTVSLGLLALDVVGADNAGWLGGLSPSALTCVTGAVLLVAALSLALTTRLGAPQVVAVLGASLVGIGALGLVESGQLVATTVLLAHAILIAAARARRLTLLTVGGSALAACWWLGLAISGLAEATSHASLDALWRHGHGLGILAASLLLLLPLPLLRSDPWAILALSAATAAGLTVTATVPALDEGATTVGLVAAATLGGWTLVSAVTPARWRSVPRLPMLLAAVPLLGIGTGLALQAAVNALGSRAPFSTGPAFALSDAGAFAHPVVLVLAVAVLLGAITSLLPHPTSPPWLVSAGTLLALGGTGSLALYPTPAVAIVGALAAIGAALTVLALRHDDRIGTGAALAGVLVVATSAAVALPSDVLTAAAAALLLGQAVGIRWWARFPDAPVLGGLLLPVTAAGLLWSVLAIAGVDPQYRALPVLVVLGALALLLPTTAVEVVAAFTGTVAASASIGSADDTATMLALHLTLAGTLVTASALVHPHRRGLGWPGGLLLAAATWVRLADLGVSAPEAYTLPAAVVLIVLGVRRLRLVPAASSVRSLSPGLLLGTVPSLLWVLGDPLSWRAVLLGSACLALCVAGPALRWSAPLLVGGAIGTLLVLRELAPYTAQAPQWALIGGAGAVLTVVGVTWERRLRDLKRASGYLGRLR